MLLPGATEPRFVSGHYCRMERPGDPELHLGLGTPQARLERNPGDPGIPSREAGTDLVLTHERFRDEADRNSHARGWQGCLDRLGRKFGG